jgi:hypothetical protein
MAVLSERVKRHNDHTQDKGDALMSDQPNMATIQLNGVKQPFIINPKNFSTGSRGFYGQGKMQVGDKNYQVNVQLVEIGSKPKAKEEKK